MSVGTVVSAQYKLGTRQVKLITFKHFIGDPHILECFCQLQSNCHIVILRGEKRLSVQNQCYKLSASENILGLQSLVSIALRDDCEVEYLVLILFHYHEYQICCFITSKIEILNC